MPTTRATLFLRFTASPPIVELGIQQDYNWPDASAISLQCQAGFGCLSFTLLFNTRIRKREITRARSLRSLVQGNAYARLSCMFPAMLYMPGAPGSGLSHRSAQRAQSIKTKLPPSVISVTCGC